YCVKQNFLLIAAEVFNNVGAQIKQDLLNDLLEGTNEPYQFKLTFEISLLMVLIENSSQKWFLENFENDEFPLCLVFQKANMPQLKTIADKIFDKFKNNKRSAVQLKKYLDPYLKETPASASASASASSASSSSSSAIAASSAILAAPSAAAAIFATATIS